MLPFDGTTVNDRLSLWRGAQDIARIEEERRRREKEEADLRRVKAALAAEEATRQRQLQRAQEVAMAVGARRETEAAAQTEQGDGGNLLERAKGGLGDLVGGALNWAKDNPSAVLGGALGVQAERGLRWAAPPVGKGLELFQEYAVEPEAGRMIRFGSGIKEGNIGRMGEAFAMTPPEGQKAYHEAPLPAQIATSILADPTTYIGAGALKAPATRAAAYAAKQATKAGKVYMKAQDVAPLVRQELRLIEPEVTRFQLTIDELATRHPRVQAARDLLDAAPAGKRYQATANLRKEAEMAEVLEKSLPEKFPTLDELGRAAVIGDAFERSQLGPGVPRAQGMIVRARKGAEGLPEMHPTVIAPTDIRQNLVADAHARGNEVGYRVVTHPGAAQDIVAALAAGNPSGGFKPAIDLTLHNQKTLTKIASAQAKGAVPVFTSPEPTVAGLYATWEGKRAPDMLFIAIEHDPKGLIYESSRVAQTQSRAYSAVYADTERVIDARSIKQVYVLSKAEKARIGEYYPIFDTGFVKGAFKNVYRDKDPALMAANAEAARNLLPPLSTLGREFKETPILLETGLKVKQGDRVRLLDGTKVTLTRGWYSTSSLSEIGVPRLAGDYQFMAGMRSLTEWDIAAVWDKGTKKWVERLPDWSARAKVRAAKESAAGFEKLAGELQGPPGAQGMAAEVPPITPKAGAKAAGVASPGVKAPAVPPVAAQAKAKPAKVIAAKVEAALGGETLTPEELLNRAAKAPKGEAAGRGLVRRFEGGKTARLMEADQEVRRVVDAMEAAGIKNVPGAPVTDASLRLMDGVAFQGTIEEAAVALKLTRAEAHVVQLLREGLAREAERMVAVDPNWVPRDFYWPGDWAPPRTIKGGKGASQRIGAKPSFMKEKTLEGTTSEIIAQRKAEIAGAITAGEALPRELIPRTGNVAEIYAARLRKGAIYRQQMALVGELERSGLAIPAREFEGEVVGWRTPKGFTPFESKPVPGKSDLSTGATLVPDEVADYLEDAFAVEGGSWARKSYSAKIGGKKVPLPNPLRVTQEIVTTAKLAKVLGGMFQNFDYTMRAIYQATKTIVGGTAHGDVTRAVAGFKMLGTPFRAMARAYVPGLDAKLTALEVAGKGAGNVRRMTLIEEGLNLQAGLGFMGSEYTKMADELLVYKIPGIGKPLKAFSSGTFRGAHREFLLDIGEKRMAALVRGGVNETEAAARTALEMNEVFSSLPAWQSVFRDPNTRLLMRNAFFSTPEQESWLRMPFRQKSFFLAAMANTVIMSEMASLAFSKELLPPEAFIPFKSDGSYNTRFLRARVGTGEDDRYDYLDLLGQADTFMRIASMVTPTVFGAAKGEVTMPSAQALGSRFNVLPSTIFQTVGGKSWFGGEPTRGSVQNFARFAATQAEPIALTSYTSERGKIGTTASLAQLSGINISAEPLAKLRDRTAATDPQFGKPYSELDRQGKFDYRAKYPGHFATSEEMPTGSAIQQSLEVSAAKVKAIHDIGTRFSQDHNGEAYMDARSTILTEAAIRQDVINRDSDYEPKTDQEKAVYEWNQMIVGAKTAAVGGVLDGAAFGALEDQAEKVMGKTKWALVEESRMASADPIEKEYLQARAKIRPYWDIQDQTWQKRVLNNSSARADMRQYSTYQEYEDSVVSRLAAQGKSAEYATLDRGIKWFTQQSEGALTRYLKENPEVDALLAYWYGRNTHSARASAIYRERWGMTPRPVGITSGRSSGSPGLGGLGPGGRGGPGNSY
ncbi:MAG TPA: hypothetical protein VNA25_30825 [Phycisphaerae bacterium]|nr:hypothetical protein [Phycisphaerae bacterium]